MGSKSRKYNFKSSVRLHKTHNILSKSLKIKLMFSYVMIALISISLIGSLTYINNKNIIKNKISGLSEKTTAQTKLSIDNYLNQIQNNIISMVFSQSDIIEYDPTDKNKSTYYQYSKQLEIEKELRSLSLIKSFKDCALIYENGTSIGQISKMNTDQDNIKKIYKQFSEELKGSANNEKWVSGYNNYYDRLYYIREINDNAILLTSILVEELNTIFEAVDDEIIIIGDSVAQGYFENSEKTAEVFFEYEGKKAYHTGDSGYFDENSVLNYNGRIDFQIKFNGFRIELQDIEAHLYEIAEIEKALVVPQENAAHKVTGLIAVIHSSLSFETKAEERAFNKKIKAQLSNTIMDYMMPTKFIYLDGFPLTPNGKIDRKALTKQVLGGKN